MNRHALPSCMVTPLLVLFWLIMCNSHALWQNVVNFAIDNTTLKDRIIIIVYTTNSDYTIVCITTKSTHIVQHGRGPVLSMHTWYASIYNRICNDHNLHPHSLFDDHYSTGVPECIGTAWSMYNYYLELSIIICSLLCKKMATICIATYSIQHLSICQYR